MRKPRVLHTLADLEDARVGDVFADAGGNHLITRIEPYDPAKVGFPGKQWCIAFADVPNRPHDCSWGITITSDKPLRRQP